MKENLRKYLLTNSTLSKNEMQVVLDSFREKRINKNDFWVKQSELCDDIAFLSKGIFRIIQENEGEVKTLHFVFPNSFTTPLYCRANNSPSSRSFQALTDCELLLINKEVHHRITNKYVHALNFHENQLIKAYSGIEHRLYSHLYSNAEQRLKILFYEHPEIFNLLPLKEIASFLGITPETLSRLRRKHLK